MENELKRELKNIFDKIHGRAKSGTACSEEPHLPKSEREGASARFNPRNEGDVQGNMDAIISYM